MIRSADRASMTQAVHTYAPGLQQTSRPLLAKGGLRKFLHRRSAVAFAMCAPLIAIIVGLIAYPACYSIYLSMLNKAQTRFVGLANFRFLLSREVFWMVAEQTAIFACFAVLFKAL